MKSIVPQHKSNIRPLQFCKVKRVAKRNLFLVFTYSFLLQANGQADKRLVQADQYFATGDYFTAAGLYGQFLIASEKIKSSDFPLNAKRNTAGKAGKYGTKLDILYRQAESYRLANYWREAADLYKECFEKNAAKYPVGLYWFAVCQRSLENYVGAEESIDRFLNGHAAGSNYQQAAEKEKATIQFIKSQLAKPDIILYQVKKINNDFGTEKGIFAPAVSSNNQYIITSTQADSVVVAGINPYRNRMFYTSLNNGSFQDNQPVTIEAMDATLNQGTPSLSADGQFLYFTQWKKEAGEVLSAIYYSNKKESGWSKPVDCSLYFSL